MPKLSHLLLGLVSIYKAIPIFWKYRLYTFAIIPGMLGIVIHTGNGLILSQDVQAEELNTLHSIWQWLTNAFQVMAGIFLYTFGNFLAVILLAPLFTWFSERCGKILTGKDYPFEALQFAKDIVRAIRLVLRNIFVQSVWIIALYLVIHVILKVESRLLFELGTFLIYAYYYGFGFLDYTLEQEKLTFKESITFIRKHRGLALSIGAFYGVTIKLSENLKYVNYNWLNGFLEILIWLSYAVVPLIAILAGSLSVQELEKQRMKFSTDSDKK